MKRNSVWIIEWFSYNEGKWLPDNTEHFMVKKGSKYFVGAETRLRDFRKRSPKTKFRLRRYSAESEG